MNCKEEIDFVVGFIAMSIRVAVVQKLLAGNDSCCFTTDQYKAAYREHVGWDTCWTYKSAEAHLRSVSELVNEVRPGLWMAVTPHYLTTAEAQRAYDVAEPVPISEERIKKIMDYVLHPKSDELEFCQTNREN